MKSDRLSCYSRLAGTSRAMPDGLSPGGGVLLLGVVSMVLLSVLAMLAMVEAVGHKELSDAACGEAAAYYAACLDAAGALQGCPDGVSEMVFPISDSQELHVRAEGGAVTDWYTAPVPGWAADEEIVLLE